jgi:acetyl esterase/lipase
MTCCVQIKNIRTLLTTAILASGFFGSITLQAKDPSSVSLITSDVVYGHKDGMALVYDVIAPAKQNGAGIIYMVSGGWFSIWQEPADRQKRFASVLAEGFTVFAVHHGSAPRFKVPDAVSDVRAAVRHIRKHATNYGVEANRLGVWGGSAGGHLSLMLGLNAEGQPDSRGFGPRSIEPKYKVDQEDSAQLAAVVAYYPPTDIRTRVGANDRYPALDFDPAAAGKISPILFVTKGDPPTLLIHGTADKVVPLKDSELIKVEFDRAGVVNKLLVIEDGNHGFRNPKDRAEANAAMLAWFKLYLL